MGQFARDDGLKFNKRKNKMQLFTSGILFSMAFFADFIQAELSPDGKNVCLQTQIYEETTEVEVLKPFTTVKTKWCKKFYKMFRCSKTVTEHKLVKQPRIVQREKIVPKCCDGYVEEKGQGKNCIPGCSQGCKNGKCEVPDKCTCAPGFYGPECEKACPKNYWGSNCANKCDCSKNGNCDNISGRCHCESGWRGESCEISCQDGYYGHYCKEKCNCDGHLCNHITGECIIETTETSTSVTLPSLQSTTSELTEESSMETETPKPNAESILNAETITIREGYLLESTKLTAFEEKTSSTLRVEEVYDEETATIKMTEEVNENEKEPKITNLKEKTFSDDSEIVTENAMEVLSKTDQIPETEISSVSNGTENIPAWTSFDEEESNLNKNETNELGSERNRKSSKDRRTFTLFYFLPSFSVISGVSFIIFIIAAKWAVSLRRKKVKEKIVEAGKKEKLFELEEQDFSRVNNCIYLPDIDFDKSIPILETFKPLNPDKRFISKEKQVK